MSRWFDKIAERRMRLAEAKGELNNLEGQGKPLPDRPGDAFIDPGEAIGFQIMAEAGALSEEISLQKTAQAQRAHLATLTDPADRKAAMANLAQIEMRQAMARDARRKFLKD